MPSLFSDFYKRHTSIVSLHVLLVLITFPMEILLLSYVTGQIFKKIQKKKYKMFFIVLLIFFSIFLFIQFFYFVQEYLNSLIIPKLDTFTRTELLNVVLQHKFDYDEIKIGELMYRISKTPGHLYKNYNNFVNYMLPLYFCVLFFPMYLFWLQWRLGLIVAVVFIVMAWIFFIYYRSFTSNVEMRFEKEHHLMDEYQDVLINVENVRIANQAMQEKDRMNTMSEQFELEHKAEIHKINAFKITAIIVLNVFLLLIIVYGIFLATTPKYTHLMPYWKLIILITATILLSKTMTTLVSKCTDGVYYSGSMNQLHTFLEKFHYTQTPQTTKHNNDTTSQPPLVTVHNYDIAYSQVAFRYPQSSSPELLFRDVSFIIPYRSNIVILGDIGSGKSTLVKMLMNTYQPISGTVSIGGVPVDIIPHEKLTSIVTYMNQNVTLFNRTIRENIFYGQEPDVEGLQQLNIPPKILENLDLLVGKNANNLSGGEKQIILLLRIYFRPVPIVILDEPTSNLDPQTKDHVIGLIQELMKSKTVICITHDTSITKFFSRAFMLQNKTLVPYQ